MGHFRQPEGVEVSDSESESLSGEFVRGGSCVINVGEVIP